MQTIEQARQAVGKELGLPSFEVPADLSAQDRETLYDGLADYIIKHFDDFPESAKQWAGRRIDSPLFREPLPEFGIIDSLSSFGGEFARQGKRIVTFEHPLIRIAAFSLAGIAIVYLASKASIAANQIKSAVK